MSLVDMAFAAMLALSVALGLWRGLSFEMLSLAGWPVAYLAAPWLAPLLQVWVPSPEDWSETWREGVSLVAGFIVLLLAWGLVARAVQWVIQASPLSLLDRLGGGAFGVLRAALLGMLVVVVVGLTPARDASGWRGAAVVPWLSAALAALRPLLPPELHPYLFPASPQPHESAPPPSVQARSRACVASWA